MKKKNKENGKKYNIKKNEEGESLIVGTNDLIEAAKDGDADQVEHLMSKYPRLLGNRDEKGKTALM